jgi:7-keto-8-aminopelargonate synthetase-like enzyme
MERIRLTVSADHSDEQIDTLLDTLDALTQPVNSAAILKI